MNTKSTKTKQNKNINWIIRNKNDKNKFFNKNYRYTYTSILNNANLFGTRANARSAKQNDEMISKVLVEGTNLTIIK